MPMSIDKIPHVLDWFSTFSGSETRLEIVTDLSLPGDADHTAEEFFKLRKQLEQYLGRDADIDIAFHYKERPSIYRQVRDGATLLQCLHHMENRFQPAADPQFSHDAGNMLSDRTHLQREIFSNLLVGEHLQDQPHNFLLPWRKLIGRAAGSCFFKRSRR